MDQILDRLAKADMKVLEWEGLLGRAEAQWEEFFDVLVERAPEDDRLKCDQPERLDDQAAAGATEE